MDWIDLIGYLAYALMIIGHIFVAKKQAKGFVFRILGGITWIALGGFLGMGSIILGSAVFVGIDIYGYLKWLKERDVEYLYSMIKK